MSKRTQEGGGWFRDRNSRGQTTGIGHRDPRREGGGRAGFNNPRDAERSSDGVGENGTDRNKITMHRHRGNGRSNGR